MDTTLPTIVVAVLTVVSPLLTSVFTHVGMDSTTKKNIAVAVSFVIAAVYVVMSGGVKDLTNLAEIASAVPLIFTIQQLIFGNLLKSLSDSIEAKVGVKGKAAPAPAGAVINVIGDVDPSVVADALAARARIEAASGGTPSKVAAGESVTPAVG